MWALLSSRPASTVVACGLVLGLVFTGAAFAATINVTTTADELDFIPNSDCSLREAIVTVNEQRSLGVGGCSVSGTIGSNDVIVVPAGLYLLTRLSSKLVSTVDQDADNLDILADVTIRGAGAGQTIIDGGEIYLPLSGGVEWSMYEGGVVRVGDGVSATIEGVTLRSGSALRGGGIYVAGSLDLLESAVESNSAGIAGAGIYNVGTLRLEQVTVSQNVGDNGESEASIGGGIHSGGQIDARNVTISGNSASASGGLYIGSAGVSILDSITVTDNEWLGDPNLFTYDPSGGIDVSSATVRIQNSIVAGNRSESGTASDCSGTFDSRGFNLIGNSGDCSGFITTDLRGSAQAPIDPLLAPLANYGGGTETHALLPDSPALDGGPLPITGDCLATDQRGLPRGLDGDGNGFVHCDIGAYEAAANQGANLELSLVGSPDPVAASGSINYRVTVRNNGPDAALGVSYRLVLPAGAGPVTSLPGGCEESGSAVNCDVGVLNAGQQVFGDIEVTAPSTLGTIIASANVSSTTDDPDAGDDEAEITTLVVGSGSADLQLQMAAPSSVSQGDTFQYRLTAANAGPGAADATARVTNFLPQNVTFVSATAGCTRANNIVTCPVPGLAAGASQELQITVTAPNQLGYVTNTASIAGASGSDGDLSNNNASFSTRVLPPPPPYADLFIEKTGPSAAQVDDELTYNLIVNNNGPDAAEDVRITDTLPAGVSVVSLPPECEAQGPTITCDLGELEPFAIQQYAVVVTAPDQPGLIVNTAVISELGDSLDPYPTNNESNVITTISEEPPPAGADLALSKSGPLRVQPQASFSYVLVVTNNGPDAALNVLLTDTLPAGLIVEDLTNGCALNNSVITCGVANLAAGASKTISVAVIAPSSEGTITNTATVVSDVNDGVPANNSDAVTTEVSEEAPVGTGSLTFKSHPDAPAELAATAGDDGVTALRFSAVAGASESVNLESLTVRAAGSDKAIGIALVELYLDANDDGSPDGDTALASGSFAAGTDTLVLALQASAATAIGANSSQNYLLLVDLGTTTATHSGGPLALLATLAILPLGLMRRPTRGLTGGLTSGLTRGLTRGCTRGRARRIAVAVLIAVSGLSACNMNQPPANGADHQLVIDAASATGVESGTAAEIVGTPLAGVKIVVRE